MRFMLVFSALIATVSAQPVGEYARESDMVYGTAFGLKLTMEVFTPAKPKGRGVVWIVSSSGVSNKGQTTTATFDRRLLPFLDRGYTVFAVIHRSAPEFQVPDYIQDARRAVRFVRHHAREFKIDGAHLGIAGSSSGGAIALTVAMAPQDGNPTAGDLVERESTRVQSAGVFFAPTDFMNFGETAQNVVDLMREQAGKVDPSFQFHDVDAKTGARTPVTDRARVLDILRRVSPVTNVTPDDPPTILIHGDADKAVPLRQSRLLMDRLNAAKVPARLVVREGKTHAWPGWETDGAVIAEWFDTYLR